MKVALLDHMGTDLTVVNAARVSFDKKSLGYVCGECGSARVSAKGFCPGCDNETWYTLSERDTGLIDFLAREKHDLVFAHCMMQVHVKAPLFVARQLWKSHIGAYMTDGVKGEAWNEVSRRYVDKTPEFYHPSFWRQRAENVKQGSLEDAIKADLSVAVKAASHTLEAINLYNLMLAQGVCPEQARMVLPQSMMTEWIWTGSLLFFSRVVRLRADSHAQRESQVIANQISEIIQPLFPVSWEALMRHQ